MDIIESFYIQYYFNERAKVQDCIGCMFWLNLTLLKEVGFDFPIEDEHGLYFSITLRVPMLDLYIPFLELCQL